jgi:tRNA (guanine-N7-)-methyltransferase
VIEAPRRVRSYVRREGRMTRAQQGALERLSERYVIASEDALDLDAQFGRAAPRMLEIGFGMGDALAATAQARPEWDFLGIEVHRPGVGSLLRRLEREAVTNVRVICADAVEVLQRRLPDAGLDAVHLFFPDPWPKSRHHKRRIVQAAFVAQVRRKLKAGGRFHLATDWEDYARHMLTVMSAAPGFRNAAGPGEYSPRPADRPLTKFEQRGRRLGHGVWDLIFVREPDHSSR